MSCSAMESDISPMIQDVPITTVTAPNIPQNTQELLSDLVHQTMLVFNSLREFRLTEPDPNRHKMRVERISSNSDAVIRTFKQLRENCKVLDQHTVQFSAEQREKLARESVMRALSGSEEQSELSELEKEKAELEKELQFYNGQLKELVDDTRTLIADINSIQFYS